MDLRISRVRAWTSGILSSIAWVAAKGILAEQLGGLPGRLSDIFEPIEIFGARYPAVIGKLVAHKQDDEDRAGQPHRQPGDIDEAVELVPGQIAQAR